MLDSVLAAIGRLLGKLIPNSSSLLLGTSLLRVYFCMLFSLDGPLDHLRYLDPPLLQGL